MRQKMLLLAAVFFGVLAFVLAYQQINYEKRKIRGGAMEYNVVKLANNIMGNEEIKDSDLSMAKVKRLKQNNLNTREILWSSKNSIVGRKLEFSKEKGQILHWSDLKPAARRRTGLSGIVPYEWRAVSIPVDNISSVSNLVQPEDHVDIIGTFRFPNMQGDKGFDTVTLTILQNVVVLATGNDWSRYTVGRTRSRGYSSVTLALTPKETEMIIFASNKGKLTLSLRNFEETEIIEDLQSVNFKFLEKNIPVYNESRKKRQQNGQ
jgi:pilus assembly protein CpaB